MSHNIQFLDLWFGSLSRILSRLLSDPLSRYVDLNSDLNHVLNSDLNNVRFLNKWMWPFRCLGREGFLYIFLVMYICNVYLHSEKFINIVLYSYKNCLGKNTSLWLKKKLKGHPSKWEHRVFNVSCKVAGVMNSNTICSKEPSLIYIYHRYHIHFHYENHHILQIIGI